MWYADFCPMIFSEERTAGRLSVPHQLNSFNENGFEI